MDKAKAEQVKTLIESLSLFDDWDPVFEQIADMPDFQADTLMGAIKNKTKAKLSSIREEVAKFKTPAEDADEVLDYEDALAAFMDGDNRTPINVGASEMHTIIEIFRNSPSDDLYNMNDQVFMKNGKDFRLCNKDLIHGWLTQRFAFIYVNKDGVLVVCNPVKDYIRQAYLAEAPSWLPRIDTIYHFPVMPPNFWENQAPPLTEEGYAPSISSYIFNDLDIDYNNLPSDSHSAHKALDYIKDELLSDFLFETESDKSNYLAYLLTFPLRPAINGNVPMYVCNATKHGAGKTLLIDLAHLLWTGKEASHILSNPEGKHSSNDEIRKAVSSALMESPVSLSFDNIINMAATQFLCGLLTTGVYRDRLLGSSKMLDLKVQVIPSVTGNNLQIEDDMRRRVYVTDLTVDREDPEYRSDFRHPRIEQWVSDNRLPLMRSIFTMIKAWSKAGGVKGGRTWGSYQEWTDIVGGVLDYCGSPQFLGKPKTRDEITVSLAGLFHVLHRDYHNFTVSEAFSVASYDSDGKGQNLLDVILTSPTENGRRKQLGRLFTKRTGGVYGKYRLVDTGDRTRANKKLYTIKEVSQD